MKRLSNHQKMMTGRCAAKENPVYVNGSFYIEYIALVGGVLIFRGLGSEEEALEVAKDAQANYRRAHGR